MVLNGSSGAVSGGHQPEPMKTKGGGQPRKGSWMTTRFMGPPPSFLKAPLCDIAFHFRQKLCKYMMFKGIIENAILISETQKDIIFTLPESNIQ
ncbi:hypothetical protein SLA2020_244900 [Shorea laevis]